MPQLLNAVSEISTDSRKLDFIKNYFSNNRLTISEDEGFSILKRFDTDSYKSRYLQEAYSRIQGFNNAWTKYISHFDTDSYRNSVVKLASQVGGFPIGKDYTEQMKNLVALVMEFDTDSYKSDTCILYFSRVSNIYATCQQLQALLVVFDTDHYKLRIVEALKGKVLDASDNFRHIKSCFDTTYGSETAAKYLSVMENKKPKFIHMNNNTISSGNNFGNNNVINNYTSVNGVKSLSGSVSIINSSSDTGKIIDVAIRQGFVTMGTSNYYGSLSWNNMKFDFILKNGETVCRILDAHGDVLFLKAGLYKTQNGKMFTCEMKPLQVITLDAVSPPEKVVVEKTVVVEKELPGEITAKDIIPEAEGEEKGGKEEVENPCDICFEQTCNAILFPCRHSKLCVNCAFKAKTKNSCPFCRGEVKNAIKTF